VHTTDSPLATFTDRLTMVYEREYPHDIDLVWEAVSTAEHLDVWMLPESRVERRLGGAFAFGWGSSADDPAATTGTVTVFEPPTAIEYGSADGSFMRFDLEPAGDATRLRFTLHFLPSGGGSAAEDYPGGDLPGGTDTPWRPGFLAGFHDMLGDLRGYLVGEFTAADRAAHLEDVFTPGMMELIEAYREHVRTTIPPA
jgi:uncharacterized protein YndB with AHSA1/START domain